MQIEKVIIGATTFLQSSVYDCSRRSQGECGSRGRGGGGVGGGGWGEGGGGGVHSTATDEDAVKKSYGGLMYATANVLMV